MFSSTLYIQKVIKESKVNIYLQNGGPKVYIKIDNKYASFIQFMVVVVWLLHDLYFVYVVEAFITLN